MALFKGHKNKEPVSDEHFALKKLQNQEEQASSLKAKKLLTNQPSQTSFGKMQAWKKSEKYLLQIALGEQHTLCKYV